MAVEGGLLKHVGNPGLQPFIGIFGDAHFHGDFVGPLEGDTADVFG